MSVKLIESQRYAILVPPRRSIWTKVLTSGRQSPFRGIGNQRGSLKEDGPNVKGEVDAFMTSEPKTLASTTTMPVLLTQPVKFETWLMGSIRTCSTQPGCNHPPAWSGRPAALDQRASNFVFR